MVGYTVGNFSFCSFVSNLSVVCHIEPRVIQPNVTSLLTSNYFDSILQDILSQIFDVIQSDVALQKQVH